MPAEQCSDTRSPHPAGSRYDSCATCSVYVRQHALQYDRPTRQCGGRRFTDPCPYHVGRRQCVAGSAGHPGRHVWPRA